MVFLDARGFPLSLPEIVNLIPLIREDELNVFLKTKSKNSFTKKKKKRMTFFREISKN